MKNDPKARFEPGEVVDHLLFGYRGVICDVDSTCQQSDAWYAEVARSKPPKDSPWYMVLPDCTQHTTYVAERNLKPASSPAAVRHPLTEAIFEYFDGTKYHLRQKVN